MVGPIRERSLGNAALTLKCVPDEISQTQIALAVRLTDNGCAPFDRDGRFGEGELDGV